MHDLTLLYELFVVFLSATIVVLGLRRLRVPHIVSFLLCGVAIGPYGFNLITHAGDIEVLAEIGVILLLFTIGLEFSLTELRRIKRYVLLGGSLQVICTGAVAFFVARYFHIGIVQAIFLSQIFALSSTAIVLSVLVARREMDTSHGRIILGILLFQDLCVVPMMLITPLLGAPGDFQTVPVLLSLGKAIVLIAMTLLLAIFVVPKLLEVLVRSKSREILVLGVIVICIGTAWLTSILGLSLALGAFIAGLAISESPYSHQVVAEILPLKDVFNSLFFVSIGMLLNLQFVANNFFVIMLLVLGVVLVKAIVSGLTVKIVSGSTRLAILVGLAIAQIGEFSFVLAKFGMEFQLLEAQMYQGFLSVTVLTMLLTPLLISVAPAIANRVPAPLDTHLGKRLPKTGGSHALTQQDHTIIIGFGPNGRYLARVLKESSIPYCILELNPRTVRMAQKDGEPIYYGDASRLEILQRVNFESARTLVITMAEIPIARRIVSVVRGNHPELYIVVRTKHAASAEELYQLGADRVIAEEFEAATEIFAHVLGKYGLPRNAIEAYIETIRREGARVLTPSRLSTTSLEKMQHLLAETIVENFLLLEDSPAAGKTLSQIDLRNKTGSSIIAIVRNNKSTVNPPANFVLAPGDLLVLMGSHPGLNEVIPLLAPASGPGAVPSKKVEGG